MKFIKRLALDRKDQQSRRFAVESDNRITTNSKASLQFPKGSTGERSSTSTWSNGQVRYNTTINDTELYNISGEGLGWERVLTNRQHHITSQNLGKGNYQNTLFGPLSYDVSTSKPQNILLFAGAAYQTPNTSYTLVSGNSNMFSVLTVGTISSGVTSLTVNTLTNIIPGQLVHTSISPDPIQNATTVVSTGTWDGAKGTINISNPTTAIINDGTTATFGYSSGVFIQFIVDNDQPPPGRESITALLGFDGYAP
jgi:hypothetical protein